MERLGFVKHSEKNAKSALEEYLKTVSLGKASGMVVKQGDDFYIISDQSPEIFLKENGLEVVLTPLDLGYSNIVPKKTPEMLFAEEMSFWTGKAEFMRKHGKEFSDW